MANIIVPKPWVKIAATPADEKTYHSRRSIIKQLGVIGSGLLTLPVLPSCVKTEEVGPPPGTQGNNDFTFEGMENFYPANPNLKYTLDRALSTEFDVTHFNNFYEFINPQDATVYDTFKYVSGFDNRDWKIEVTGLAQNTGTFFLGDLIQEMGLEERTYRHRCVEAWAMAVPWTGFPLAKLLNFFQPDSSASHIRTISFSDPNQMIGVRTQTFYPWPFFEGLRMDEAMNELAFVATGLFGKPLPKQNGAPIRWVIPWKYGYKSPKSIVKIEFLDSEPETFWHQVEPLHHSFLSNVLPDTLYKGVPQSEEVMIIDGLVRPTQKYNGYGDFVAGLYE